MNKTNVFCSSEFYMAQRDVLHVLMIDEAGTEVTIDVSNPGVNATPGAPTSLPATDITSSSFSANWYFNEDTEGYCVDIATDEYFTVFVSGFENLDVGNVNTISVTGLTPAINYFYRVRAYNDYGTSENSNTITTETAEPPNVYGALYNWYAVNNAHGIAPDGWHVPTNTELTTLTDFLGGLNDAGGKLKETGLTHWQDPNTGATNESGFSAPGSGDRVYNTGLFVGLLTGFSMWASTQFNATQAWGRLLNFLNNDVNLSSYYKNAGQSIRLIKDDSVNPAAMVDYDGNSYPTVTIGTQVWMAENLKVTHYKDGTPIPNITDNTQWSDDTVGAMCYYDNITP